MQLLGQFGSRPTGVEGQFDVAIFLPTQFFEPLPVLGVLARLFTRPVLDVSRRALPGWLHGRSAYTGQRVIVRLLGHRLAAADYGSASEGLTAARSLSVLDEASGRAIDPKASSRLRASE